MIHKIITTFVCISILASQVAVAQSSLSKFHLTDEAFKTRLSEFFYNQNKVDVLVSVKLIGNVNKPDLYHLPKDTALLTLLSIAGGPSKNADTEKITLSSRGGG